MAGWCTHKKKAGAREVFRAKLPAVISTITKPAIKILCRLRALHGDPAFRKYCITIPLTGFPHFVRE